MRDWMGREGRPWNLEAVGDGVGGLLGLVVGSGVGAGVDCTEL